MTLRLRSATLQTDNEKGETAMSRQPRQFSESGYLHLVLRGIGKQILFEDREDRVFYLAALQRYCRDTEVKVCAYCLMENHVHLLVCDPKGNTPILMKKLGVSYAGHFNRKYERSGHLFQDRYRSEAVEDDSYLLAVFRYILNNPQKAGLCPASAYEWSSFSAYDDPLSFVDVSIIRDLIGDREQYLTFLSADNEDVCLEDESFHRDDQWAREIMKKLIGTENGTSLQKMDRLERNTALRGLKNAGLSVRQIERLTGINRNIVQKA